jgi:hypothetical protein
MPNLIASHPPDHGEPRENFDVQESSRMRTNAVADAMKDGTVGRDGSNLKTFCRARMNYCRPK